MQLSISGRHVDIGTAFQGHVEGAIADFAEKHHLNAIESSVTLSKEGPFFRTDITIHIGRGMNIRAQGKGDDANSSFANALDTLTQRVRRHKKRLRDHHKAHDVHLTPEKIQKYILNGSASEPEEDVKDLAPAIIAENQEQLQTLTVGEAVMRMDLEDVPAYIFRDKNNRRINVLYRRDDGNIAWVDPKENN